MGRINSVTNRRARAKGQHGKNKIKMTSTIRQQGEKMWPTLFEW